MAKLNFVKSAQKTIYTNGKAVEYVSQKGKRLGQTLTKIDRTIPANKNDKPYILKGEPYYWWCLMIGQPKQFSKTRPRRSQLTLSSFLSTLWDLEDNIQEFNCSTKDDFDSFKEDIISQVEELRDQCQESLDNMPEGLQSGPTGELLQERVDGLESWLSDIESVECEELDEDDDHGDQPDDTETPETVLNALEELKGTSSGL